MLVLILILAVYIFMPFFREGWANAHCEEDAYYYFSIARNLAQGQGLTYAGEWTNGFQPLWQFLISVIFLFPTSLMTPVKIALVLGGIFFLMSGLMVYRSGLLLWKEKSLAQFATLVWLSCIFAFEQAMNGLETGLYFFGLSGLIYVFLKRIRLNPSPGLRDWIYLGLVSGICFLARIDACLILVPIWGAGWWHTYRKLRRVGTKVPRTVRKSIFHIFIGFLVFLALALPWVGYNLWLWGNPLPVSAYFAGVQFWQEMTFKWRVAMSLKALLRLPLFYPLSFYTYFRHWNQMNFILLAIGSLIWGGCFLFDRKLRDEVLKLPLGSMIFAAAFLTLGYLIPTTAHWFIPRYLAPVILLLLFYAAVFWHHYLGRNPVLIGGVCAALIVFSPLLDYYGAGRKNLFPKYYLNIYRLENVEWIKKHLPANKPIASFQSGIYHYYLSPAGYQFYNLDGKVSISAYQALKGNRLDRYVREKRIVYMIDWTQYLKPFFKNYHWEPEKDYRILGRLESDDLAELVYNGKEFKKDELKKFIMKTRAE